MTRALALAALLTATLASTGAAAGESTVTLNVDMWCASCPYIIKQSLAQVEGVRQVKVSFVEKTARVIFDDSRTSVAALMQATDEVGFPSTVRK